MSRASEEKLSQLFCARRGRLYSSCMQSNMLHGSETWPVRKENKVALQRAEMRMVRWMCNVKVKDRVPSNELRERLGIDDIILILQQNRLRWYGHVLRKEDTDWVKKCMKYEVEGSPGQRAVKRLLCCCCQPIHPTIRHTNPHYICQVFCTSVVHQLLSDFNYRMSCDS